MREWTSDVTTERVTVGLDSATATVPPLGRLVVMSDFERYVRSCGWPDDVRDKLLSLEERERRSEHERTR